MTKHEYLSIAMRQSVSWLIACAENPSQGMTPMHVALIRIAIRRKRSL